MKNKKRIAISAAALAGCLVIGGTFAWFSTTDKVTNKFDMDAFDVAITEDFDQNPDVPLVPGADITKNVTVTNSGNMDVVVRVKLEEMLQLLERYTDDGTDKLKVTYEETSGDKTGKVPVLMSENLIDAYEKAGYSSYTTNTPEGVTVLRKAKTTGDNTVYSYIAYKVIDEENGIAQVVKLTPQGTDKANPTGFTAQYAYHTYDGTGVTGTYAIDKENSHDNKLDTYYDSTTDDSLDKAIVLNFAANVDTNGNDIDSGANWYLAKDGYFYYTKVLEGNTISDPLLSSVSIAEDAANALQGAKYELTPVMEASQAEEVAVENNWFGKEDKLTTGSTLIEKLKAYIATIQ